MIVSHVSIFCAFSALREKDESLIKMITCNPDYICLAFLLLVLGRTPVGSDSFQLFIRRKYGKPGNAGL